MRLTTSTLALLAAVPALAQDAPGGAPGDAPVSAVTLFEAGLAELTRDTGAASAVTLRVPLRDVDDVLKSLLLRGEGVTGGTITLDGPDPVADAFASLPFPPEAATDLGLLLRSVPGLRVRISDAAYPEGREGTLMGATEDCTADGGCETVLTVLHDDGAIRRHVLAEGLDLTILDGEVTEALARGLAALRGAASGQVREVTVAIAGAPTDGALSYVVAAPAWKTAYRALTEAEGAVDLQAWAVVENATGEDWEDVALTLSSGSPRTLEADLYGRSWRLREAVEPAAPAMVEPVPAARAFDMTADLAAGAAMEAAPAPVAAPVAAQATAEEGAVDSRFSLAAPVDLAAGEMVSLPFLSESLDATHLSVWRSLGYPRTGNPDLVLEVTNALPVRLPAGIMTVSDATGGYVGDADFPLVAPGETRAVPYGTDREARVEERRTSTETLLSVRASGGVVRVSSEAIQETTYVVSAPGEAREVAIDHPLQEGWTTAVPAGPQGAERTDADGSRWLRLTVQAGAEDATVVVRDAYPMEQVIALGELDDSAILAWSGEAATDADRAYLDEAARLMQARSAAADALARAEGEAETLTRDQERVRRLLSTVQNPSAAYDRYLAQLLGLEDRIAEATAATQTARAAAAAAGDALTRHLEG